MRRKGLSFLIVLMFLLGSFSLGNSLNLIQVNSSRQSNDTTSALIRPISQSNSFLSLNNVLYGPYNATIENTTITNALVLRNTRAYFNNVTINQLGVSENGYSVIENSTIGYLMVYGRATTFLRNVTVTNIQIGGFTNIYLENVTITGMLAIFGVSNVSIENSTIGLVNDFSLSTVNITNANITSYYSTYSQNTTIIKSKLTNLGISLASINASGWTSPTMTFIESNITNYYGPLIYNGPGYLDIYSNANVSYEFPISLDTYTESSIQNLSPQQVVYTGNWVMDNLTVFLFQEVYMIGGTVSLKGGLMDSNANIFLYNTTLFANNVALPIVYVKDYSTFIANNVTFNRITFGSSTSARGEITNSTGALIHYTPPVVENTALYLGNVTIQSMTMMGDNVKFENLNVTNQFSWWQTNTLNASLTNVTTNILRLNLVLNGTGISDSVEITEEGFNSQNFELPFNNITYNMMVIEELDVYSATVTLANISAVVQITTLKVYDGTITVFNTSSLIELDLNNSTAQLTNNTSIYSGVIITAYYSNVTATNTLVNSLFMYNKSIGIIENSTISNQVNIVNNSTVNITLANIGSVTSYFSIVNSRVTLTNVLVLGLLETLYLAEFQSVTEVYMVNVTANVLRETYIVNGTSNVLFNASGIFGNAYRTILNMNNVTMASYEMVLTAKDSAVVTVNANNTLTKYYLYDSASLSIINVITNPTVYMYDNSELYLSGSSIGSLQMSDYSELTSNASDNSAISSLQMNDNSVANLKNITLLGSVTLSGNSYISITNGLFNVSAFSVTIEFEDNSTGQIIQSEFYKNNNVTVLVNDATVRNLEFENASIKYLKCYVLSNTTVNRSFIDTYEEVENTEISENTTEINALKNRFIDTNITTINTFINGKFATSPVVANNTGIYFSTGVFNITILTGTQISTVITNNTILVATKSSVTIENTTLYKLYLILGEYTEIPDIVEHGIEEIEEGYHANIYWEITTPYTGSYTILMNDSSYQSGNFYFAYKTKIIVDLSTLSIGLYNFTLVVSLDDYESNSSTIIVNVIPAVSPQIDAIINGNPVSDTFTYERGLGYTLMFQIDDATPDTYQFIVNDVLNDTGTFTNNFEYNISLDDFAPGTYNFTMVATDGLNQKSVKTVIVTIFPEESPIITLLTPTQNTTILDNQTLTISWQLFDASPNIYHIFVNGTIEDSGSWTNGSIVNFVFQKAPGTYNVTIHVVDKLGNDNVNTIFITVNPSQAGGGTGGPPGEQPLQDNFLLIIAIIVVVALVSIVIIIKKRKR